MDIEIRDYTGERFSLLEFQPVRLDPYLYRMPSREPSLASGESGLTVSANC
jgi:hypothetical protein